MACPRRKRSPAPQRRAEPRPLRLCRSPGALRTTRMSPRGWPACSINSAASIARPRQDRNDQTEHDRQPRAARRWPCSRSHALRASENGRRNRAPDGSALAQADPFRGERLGHRWSTRRIPARFRMERATVVAAASAVEFENTNALGKGKKYARFKVPGGGIPVPRLRPESCVRRHGCLRQHGQAQEPRDLRRDALAEELLWDLPASIYGDDAGVDEPNEKSQRPDRKRPCTAASASLPNPHRRNWTPVLQPRAWIPRAAHRRGPGPGAAHRSGNHRWVESIAGGEGPWIKGVHAYSPACCWRD